MSRSIKKGPFVQEVLLKRVQAMNETGEKKVLKDLEPVLPQFSLTLSDTPLQCMMAASMFRFM